MISSFECAQCGSTEFIEVGARRVDCAYCKSQYQLITKEPVLVINKGANVIFGKNADVEIRGDIEVQSGANVDIQGKVTVHDGNKKQDFQLTLIKDNHNKHDD